MKKGIPIILMLLICCCKTEKREDFSVEQEQNKKSESIGKIDFDKYVFHTTKGTDEQVALESGKKYILDFWYIECAPCVKDHKLIVQKVDSLKKKNIEVLGFSIDRSKKDWKEYLVEHGYNWRNYNQHFEDPNLKETLEIKLFPTYFLVDSNGEIYQKTNSFKKILDYLSKG